MSNMGYCRFQNTLKNLRECAEALEGIDNLNELSKEETKAAAALIAACQDIGCLFDEDVIRLLN